MWDPPFEIDSRWWCTCCLGARRLHFTSCWNRIFIVIVGLNRFLAMNEWMYEWHGALLLMQMTGQNKSNYHSSKPFSRTLKHFPGHHHYKLHRKHGKNRGHKFSIARDHLKICSRNKVPASWTSMTKSYKNLNKIINKAVIIIIITRDNTKRN